MQIPRSPLGLAAVLLLASCTDPVDKAAKARIFSPEDPPKVVASATQPIAAAELENNPTAVRRVLEMDAAEATERLGPHKYDALVRFVWTGKGGSLQLTEKRQLEAGRGGVNGDFHATLENSRDQGLEVIRYAGKVFAKSKYQKFRQRSRDRGMAERVREETYGVLQDVDEMFQRRIVVDGRQSSNDNGRKTWRYQVHLGPADAKGGSGGAGGSGTSDVQLPPTVAPKEGTDPSTLRRLAFLDKREPVELKGLISVDEETGVVIASKLDGKIKMPAIADAPPAELAIHVETTIKDVGATPSFGEPKEFLADADKPQGIADALDRFGIPRAGAEKKDGGAADTEEEDDEGAR